MPSNTMTALDHHSIYAPHWAHYPRSYVVHPASRSFLNDVDGDLTKDVWKDVPWSDPFGDIQGCDGADGEFDPPALTQFKALYDDTHLYIGALLHPSPHFNTAAHFVHRNDPIYQKDSDFEVFVDIAGSCANYKELEVNALNTVWNLMLDVPYDDGGVEHSARVAHDPSDPLYYEVYNQRTAVRVLEGQLNDPSGSGALWSVEMALAYTDLLHGEATNNQNAAPPRPGPFWRVNFSRVELEGRVNWTWQPQVIWDAALRKFAGKIQMHLPDAWGYFVFASDKQKDDKSVSSSSSSFQDPHWPLRLTATHVYYAQRTHFDLHGRYATDMPNLKLFVDAQIVAPFAVDIIINDPTSSKSYTAMVRSKIGDFDGAFATITDKRLLLVKRAEGEDLSTEEIRVA